MSRFYSVTIILAVTLVSCVGVFTYLNNPAGKSKVAFVVNQTVFDEFNGTKDRKKILIRNRDELKFELDSMNTEITALEASGNAAMKNRLSFLKARYEKISIQYSEQLESDQEAYTAELWTQINQSMLVYGNEKGYDFVFGASGNGTVMFADSSLDVTKDFVQYLNMKYEGK